MDEREDDTDDWDEEEVDGDEGDLRRRTFLERHSWIPWMAAAILVGGILGSLPVSR